METQKLFRSLKQENDFYLAPPHDERSYFHWRGIINPAENFYTIPPGVAALQLLHI